MAKPIDPEEEREREEQGRALLEAVRQMREREAGSASGFASKSRRDSPERDEERRREEEGGSGPRAPYSDSPAASRASA